MWSTTRCGTREMGAGWYTRRGAGGGPTRGHGDGGYGAAVATVARRGLPEASRRLARYLVGQPYCLEKCWGWGTMSTP